MPLRSLKSWTFHTLHPAGSVVIDRGAHLVLSRRDSGGRLLPAGVLDVKGTFAAGQAVVILAPRVDTSKEGEGGGPPTPTTSSQFNSIPTTPTLSPRNSIQLAHNQDSLFASPNAQESVPDDQLVEVGRGLANYQLGGDFQSERA